MTKAIKSVNFRSSDVNDALRRGASLAEATKEAIRKSKKTVHLYWGFRLKNAEQMLEITKVCCSECDAKGLLREEVTLDREKVTCPKCRAAKAKRPPPPEPEKVITPPDATRRLPRGKWPWPPGAKIKILDPRNPQAKGSPKHKRWAMVWSHGGKSWEVYRDAGGNPDTLRNVVREKLAEVQP